VPSVEFLSKYDLPYIKVAGAMVTNIPVLEAIRDTGKPVILSTGGSTQGQVHNALRILRGSVVEYILACTATYPCPPEEQNLEFIKTLKHQRPAYKIGFSNHSPGITFCIIAAALGAEMIEYHMTLDRAMYGSDQAASIELSGMMSLNKKCRQIKAAMGTGQWTVFDSEKKVMEKLRHDQSEIVS
jgi:N-acetylneuraminate synthase